MQGSTSNAGYHPAGENRNQRIVGSINDNLNELCMGCTWALC